jgi:membrane associated rhomboid family serine protease
LLLPYRLSTDGKLFLLELLPPDIWGLNSYLSLYSLIALCLVSLIAVRKMSLAWSWPYLAKVGLIIVVAALGLLVGPIWIFSLIAWFMFVLLLFILPLIILRLQNKYVMELNGKKVVYVVGYLRWFYWGKTGQFWSDWANAFSLYVEGKKDAADEILAKWKSENVPEQLQVLANDYRFYGYTLSRDWQRIVSAYETAKETGGRISNTLYLATCRAYAELRQFDSSAECLGQAKLLESKAGVQEQASTYMVFFCLTGQTDKAKQLLAILTRIKHLLPAYVRTYWLGRLALANGDKTEAKSQFEIALKQCTTSTLYQERIAEQIKRLDSSDSGETRENDATIALNSISEAHAKAVENSWATFRKTARGLDIIEPLQNSRTVTTVLFFILATFVVSYAYLLLPNPATAALSTFCFKQGLLIPEQVRSGEYWRVVSCLFLHLHFFHLLFNLMGLWWFGRVAQNIFGTVGFLIVYFAAGIVSGAAYVLLGSTLPALGASGAIMGVVGAVAVGVFRLHAVLPQSIRKRQLLLLTGLLVLQTVMDQIIPNIGVSIHMFGLITGALIGFILPLQPLERPEHN